MKLRIATYNIHKGVSSFGSRPRVHALKQAIASFDADIIFLQEVQGRHDLHAARHTAQWPQEAQHQFLAGDSHHAVYGMNSTYHHGHHGNALLSRFPIIYSRNQDVSDHAYEQRGILHCVVQTPCCDIHCYVVHFGLFARSRRRQSQALIEAVETYSPRDLPIVVAGDFNDWGDHLSDVLRSTLKVREVFDEQKIGSNLWSVLRHFGWTEFTKKPARTFPAALPWLRLDRIYVRGLEIGPAQVLHGVRWAALSDHAPVVVDVNF